MERRLRFFVLLLCTAMTLSSCGGRKEAPANPLLSEWDTPYGVPPFDRIVPADFPPAFDRAMSLHNAEIEAIASDGDEPTFDNTMLAYDRAGLRLGRLRLLFDMLSASDATPEMQSVRERMMPLLAEHDDRIRMNERLFARIRTLYDVRRSLGLDADEMRLLERTYDEFVRSGALLDADEKARLQRINADLAAAGARFGAHLLAATKAYGLVLDENELEGLPPTVRDAARARAAERGLGNRSLFTLDEPSRLGVLTHSSRRDLREAVYRAYTERCARDSAYDNTREIVEISRLRLEKARLLGYASYADYALSDCMARTPETADRLLADLWEPALEQACEELGELESLRQRDRRDTSGSFEAWDWWYYAEKLRKRDYAVDEEMLRPYFSLENVRTGIFFLANRLYGITFRPVVVPVSHPQMLAYEVLDADASHLGVLYFDLFSRAGKSGGAWCGLFTEQYYDADGRRVAPAVGVVCNFAPASGTTPTLLTLDETATLFHEFGHALHFLFRDVRYRGLSEVEGDFVELPSQIMENWAFEPEMLRQYATHYRTGDIIPDELVRKLRRSLRFNQGFALTELVAAARTDLDLHRRTEDAPFDPAEFERALTGRYGLIPQIAPRYRYPYFAHIFDGGYEAGYYFYLWAEVLDKDAFEAFRESGDLFDRRLAERFRREVLEPGGSRSGEAMFRAFRGREPDRRAMLRARGLLDEPDTAIRPAPPRMRPYVRLDGDEPLTPAKPITK